MWARFNGPTVVLRKVPPGSISTEVVDPGAGDSGAIRKGLDNHLPRLDISSCDVLSYHVRNYLLTSPVEQDVTLA